MLNERKKIWVQAVGRVGYYNDIRRYPIGHGHPRAGEPFQVFEDEFSDYKNKLNEKSPVVGLNGWMKRVDENEINIINETDEPIVKKHLGRPKKVKEESVI